jgi:hypothetical protein
MTMKGIKQAPLFAGSTAALIIVAPATYFLVVHPSLISLLGFVAIVPVFLTLGLGFLRIARNLG